MGTNGHLGLNFLSSHSSFFPSSLPFLSPNTLLFSFLSFITFEGSLFRYVVKFLRLRLFRVTSVIPSRERRLLRGAELFLRERSYAFTFHFQSGCTGSLSSSQVSSGSSKRKKRSAPGRTNAQYFMQDDCIPIGKTPGHCRVLHRNIAGGDDRR